MSSVTPLLPAAFMRGGTSKGLFFRAADIEAVVGHDAVARDRLLLRLVGSPDRYGTQIDGMGGGSSSTSKVVLVARSALAGHDVDMRFGAVAIDQPLIDWSGNCGNLSAAVAPFAISAGLVAVPHDGIARVVIRQADIGKTIVAHLPIKDGQPLEHGDCEIDGVAFAGAPIRLDFVDPGGHEADPKALLPTGNVVDRLRLPWGDEIEATLLNAGNPIALVDAAALGLTGIETQADVNGDDALRERLEAVRAAAAVAMGLAGSLRQATQERPATPKLCFVAAPRAYVAADGRRIDVACIDFLARIMSMGKLHHAMTGTGIVALAAAASLDGSVLHRLTARSAARRQGAVRIGHPAGTVQAEAAVSRELDGTWHVHRVSLTRTARMLMRGVLPMPAGAWA